MQKSTKAIVKAIVTIVAIVIFIILFAIVTGVRSGSDHSTPGFFGIILFAALIGALRAVWKKKDDNENNTGLQK